MNRCERCGRWTWGTCNCRRFKVSVLQWDRSYPYVDGSWDKEAPYLDFHDQYAVDPETAAAASVEHRDCGEYDVVQGEEVNVLVYDPQLGASFEFVVRGEYSAEYWAEAAPMDGRRRDTM